MGGLNTGTQVAPDGQPRPWRALVRVAALVRPSLRQLAGSTLMGAGAVVAAAALLALSGYLISRAAQQPPMLTLLVVIVGVRVLGMARAGLRYGERLSSHDLAFRVLAGLRERFWTRLAATLPARASGRSRGDLLSRFVADVEALQHVYLRGLGPPLAAVVVSVLAVVAAWVLLPAAALILALALLLGGVLVPVLAGRLAAGSGRRQSHARAALTSELVEVVEGSAELAVNGREREWSDRVRAADFQLAAIQRRDALAAGATEGLGTLVAGLALAGVAAVGVAAVQRGALDGVLLAAVILLALGTFEAIGPLRDAARHLHSSAAAAVRVQDVTAAQPTVPDPDRPLPVPTGDLVVHGVDARYDADGPWVLRDVSLALAPGRRIALVGLSGSGKSTLASLLVRFRDPDGGAVTLGGTDLRGLRQEDVRATVRLADQDAHLFTASVAANVRLARPEASDEAIESALAEAGLGEWLASLPDGIATLVGRDGAEVSGGQRQRIALARVLLADSRFVVCDEPAAHLDSASARNLLGHLARLPGNRGVLVITHVHEGLDDFDEVLTLQDGRLG